MYNVHTHTVYTLNNKHILYYMIIWPKHIIENILLFYYNLRKTLIYCNRTTRRINRILYTFAIKLRLTITVGTGTMTVNC